jgi:hypothetical protein
MSRFCWPWAALLVAMPLAAAQAAPALQAAACPSGAGLAALSGTWQAEALAHVPGGVAPSRQRLQLQVGADGRVRGQRDWAAVITGPAAVQGRDRQGQAAFADVQPMIGWIEPRSCRVLLVETEDAGRVSGWLRRQGGESVLELEISQSGRGAVVVMTVFRQQPASPRAPGNR